MRTVKYPFRISVHEAHLTQVIFSLLFLAAYNQIKKRNTRRIEVKTKNLKGGKEEYNSGKAFLSVLIWNEMLTRSSIMKPRNPNRSKLLRLEKQWE